MTDRQLRWRLGIFALIALVLLGTLIVLFGSLPPLFKRFNTYYVRFQDAPGLRVGVPVHRSGVRVGEVTAVTLNDEDGTVTATINVDPHYTVRANEQPTLILGFLGTDASIDFIPKPPPLPNQTPDRAPIPPGSELNGTRQVSVSTLINRASEVVPTTQEVLNDMRKSLKRLEEMAPLLEQTLREYRNLGASLNRDYPDLEKSLKGASDDIAATARQYRQLGENLNVLLLGNQDKVVKVLDTLPKTLESINRTADRFALVLSDDNIKNVTATIKNIREASDYAPAIAKNVRDASEQAPAIAKSLREVTDQAPAITKNVREASEQAPAIAKNLREASESLPSIAKNTDELLKEARPMLQHLQQTLTKADAALTDLQKLSQSFGERGPSITRNLDESLTKFNRVMSEVNDLMRVIGQSDGTLKRILADPSLYNDLDAAACQIAKMMPRLDRILKDIETFADKLARHPELIGVGGAVKGSDGLKDPPKIGVTPH